MIEVTDEMREILMPLRSEWRGKAFDFYITQIIELHEANKPKPEPVAFIIHSKDAGFWCVETLEEAERIAISLDGARFEPLYNATPTREPLSNDEINRIVEEVIPNGAMLDLVRAIEKAHGIGV